MWLKVPGGAVTVRVHLHKESIRILFFWIKWVSKRVKDFMTFLLEGFSYVDMIDGMPQLLDHDLVTFMLRL